MVCCVPIPKLCIGVVSGSCPGVGIGVNVYIYIDIYVRVSTFITSHNLGNVLR